MKTSRFLLCVVVLAFVLTCPGLLVEKASAVPAIPAPRTLTQPDGKSFNAYLRGDEFKAWVETPDGHTILPNRKTGYWEYAVRNPRGQVVSSGVRVRPRVAPPNWVPAVPLPRQIIPYARRTPLRDASDFLAEVGGPMYGNWDPQPVSGTRNLLILLVQFSDRNLLTAPASWDSVTFNTAAGVKSVANYYTDNSFGLLTVQPVTHTQAGNPPGLVTVNTDMTHPDWNTYDFDLQYEIQWINAALADASNYVDFGALDTNGDGTLQTSEAVVYLVVAGYEQSEYGPSPAIWAHAWWGGLTFDAGGVDLHSIAMNGELHWDDGRMSIGVITHELGHSMCNLPDLYDTNDYNSGLGIFSLMASGSWGAAWEDEYHGDTPVSMDAWSRQYIAWSTPRTTDTTQTMTFGPSLASTDAPVRLRNSALSQDQYFLVENRYSAGWDKGMEWTIGPDWGGGLLIQHIDETIGTWVNNDINAYVWGSHQGVMAEEASTYWGSLFEGTSRGDVTHLFWSGNNANWSDTTTPNSRLYNNTSTFFSVANVSGRAEQMTATIIPGAPVPTPAFSPNGGNFTNVQNVTVTCSLAGSTIHYTKNGVEPTESDPVVASGSTVLVDRTMTLKAKAWKAGRMPSDTKSAQFNLTLPRPTFTPDGGTFTSAQNITVTCAVSGVTIRYTTNGADPTATSATVAQGGKVLVSGSMTLKAKAWKDGWTPSSVKAAVYTIRSPIIYRVKAGSTSASPNGLTWTTAFPKVQQAMNMALSGDEIWVAKGTYIENIQLKSGVKLYGGFAGTETQVSQRNFTSNVTILDGNRSASVINVAVRATADTRIDGFTIRNGSARAGGGGIRCYYYCSPTIVNNIIAGNYSYSSGGGIYCQYYSSPAIISNTITANTAGQTGGGIAVLYSSSPIIGQSGKANTITSNVASSGGGGIAVYYDSNPTIAYNTISGNSGYQGGAISCYSAVASITRNTISNNAAIAHSGGGIFCYSATKPSLNTTISWNTVLGNRAAASGGGIFCDYKSSPDILDNTIKLNTAGRDGAGIYLNYQCASKVASNLIASNTAVGYGGGICCRYYSSPAIVNNTLVKNKAAAGGGVFTAAYSAPTIVNNIVALGSSGLRCDATRPVHRRNCVYGNEGAAFTGMTADATEILVNPLFRNADAGDYHLQTGSPCINVGDNTVVTNGWLDLDGKTRIVGATVDLGAFEVQ